MRGDSLLWVRAVADCTLTSAGRWAPGPALDPDVSRTSTGSGDAVRHTSAVPKAVSFALSFVQSVQLWDFINGFFGDEEILWCWGR